MFTFFTWMQKYRCQMWHMWGIIGECLADLEIHVHAMDTVLRWWCHTMLWRHHQGICSMAWTFWIYYSTESIMSNRWITVYSTVCFVASTIIAHINKLFHVLPAIGQAQTIPIGWWQMCRIWTHVHPAVLTCGSEPDLLVRNYQMRSGV
jgi:hypothetical protein